MEIKVPPLGESVSEATVAKWFVAEGEAIAKDQPLVELETEKVTLEVNAPVSGVLSKIVAPAGTNVPVGALLGELAAGAVAEGRAVAAAPAAVQAKPEAPAPRAAPETLSPAVRKLVAEHGLKAGRIEGSGPGGRILKGDVLAVIEGGKGREPAAPTAQAAPARAAPQAPAAPSGLRPEAAREERVRMSRLRKRIAERLKEAQNTAAMLTTFNECDLTNVARLRHEHRERFEKKHAVKLGLMSFFVKASIAALKEIPEANAEIEGEDILYKRYYHIGVAVSAPQGLVVPVLRDADRLGFAEIEKAIGALGAKARDGKLALEELVGGTFTITNGGIFGSLMSTPILNPPQSAILGMHKIMDRAIVVEGRIEARPMMYLALSYDHRLIDGREAVTFLVRVKERIENPDHLLLDL